jgi:hypothetical protein
MKGKLYKTVVRPAMLFGLETVTSNKMQEAELKTAEMKMLRFSFGVMRTERRKNEYIRGTAHVVRFSDKAEMVWACPEER